MRYGMQYSMRYKNAIRGKVFFMPVYEPSNSP